MSRWSLYAAVALPDYVKAQFAAAFDATFNETGLQLSQDQVRQSADGKQILVVSVANKLDRPAIEKLPASIKAIACYSVGFDHVDLQAAKARGIAVFNTPEV